jgi:hypothetical protein
MSYKFFAKRNSEPKLEDDQGKEQSETEQGVLHSWVVIGFNSSKFGRKLMNFRSSPLPAQHSQEPDGKRQ